MSAQLSPILRKSIPNQVEIFTLRRVEHEAEQVQLFRHFIVKDIPEFYQDDVNRYVKILPRPDGIPANVECMVSDTRKEATDKISLSKAAEYMREYRNRPGIRQRQNRLQKTRRMLKKHILKCEVAQKDRSLIHQGLLQQIKSTTNIKITDIVHRFGYGKHLHENGDKTVLVQKESSVDKAVSRDSLFSPSRNSN